MIWAILMGELTFMLGGETSMGTVYTWAVAHQQCITGPSSLHATKVEIVFFKLIEKMVHM